MTISAAVSHVAIQFAWSLMSEISSETQPSSDSYEIVANLLVRQEQVLEELDELNTRIEATIKSINATRQSEAAAEQAAATDLELPAHSTLLNDPAGAKAA
jgi:hypothetical protein